MRNQPIGVIDSGLGGLTVWRELVKVLPHESFIYFGDSGYCPYGSRSPEAITRRVRTIVDFLIEKQCKLIVVACNAITAACIAYLRGHYDIPFVGMEPAIKPALLETRTRAIGVLATQRTLEGELFDRTKTAYGNGIAVIEQVGHGLVEFVEALDFDGPDTMKRLSDFLRPMIARNIDYLVLGCTHYPFLEPAMREILGDAVTIVNPAPAVARHATHLIKTQGLARSSTQPPNASVFYTTGDKTRLERLLQTMEIRNHTISTIDL